MLTGDMQMITREQGAKLNEDWQRGKPVRNEQGQKVFRFNISTTVVDRNGKEQNGVAVVDIQEVSTEEVQDGNGTTE